MCPKCAPLSLTLGLFYGGDTRLGPWVYKTCGAVVRTVQSLEGQSAILQALFVGYAKLFLRITHGISRQQEFSADALAACSVGAEPLKNGLRIMHGTGQAFVPFWTQEIAPAIPPPQLPEAVVTIEPFIRYIEQHNHQSPPTDEVKNFATSIVGAAITCYLHK